MMNTAAVSKIVRYATVTPSALSVDRALAAVSSPSVGGVAIFVGVVRDHDAGQAVTSLDSSAHPRAEILLLESAERVARAHEVTTIVVEHRVGHLAVGDLAV